jgi:hypothetical protein
MGQKYNGKVFFVCTTSILVGAGSLWSQAQYYHLTNDLTTENNLPLNNSTFQFGFPCANIICTCKYSNKFNNPNSYFTGQKKLTSSVVRVLACQRTKISTTLVELRPKEIIAWIDALSSNQNSREEVHKTMTPKIMHTQLTTPPNITRSKGTYIIAIPLLWHTYSSVVACCCT